MNFEFLIYKKYIGVYLNTRPEGGQHRPHPQSRHPPRPLHRLEVCSLNKRSVKAIRTH